MTQQQKSKEPNGGTPGRLSMDLKHIKNLIELMVDNDLSRMELREGDTHILLRRGQPIVASSSLMTSPAASGLVPPGEPVPGVVPTSTNNEIFIRSPMVGTFYAAADPESPPFVSVGNTVEPQTVVCLIEAMKVFNELKAEVAGRVTRILVKNAEAVEFDQPLFALTPA
jgi:acetyl-CoA carboxylase biotin carboxyl carrier protein